MINIRKPLMFNALEILTVILVAVAMAMALAHALELPGKMRLEKDVYYAVQPIYYPGFTIGGAVGEFGGMVSTLVLLVLTPLGSVSFWVTFAALLGLLGMQAVYWLSTHPVNQFWVKGENLNSVSSSFFSLGANKSGLGKEDSPEKWKQLRNRWEYSHVARAVLGLCSLFALVIAVSNRNLS
jgi:hypothetical protein